MQFNAYLGPGLYCPPGLLMKKFLRVMKLTTVLLMVASMHVSANAWSQKVTMAARKTTLSAVLKGMQKQTGVSILWEERLLDGVRIESLDAKDANLYDVLNTCLANTNLRYTKVDNIIVIQKQAVTETVAYQTIQGFVKDEKGQPLQGITVSVKGKPRGAITAADGSFSIDAEIGAVLVFTGVGFDMQEHKVTHAGNMLVQLKTKPVAIEAVEVVMSTGYQDLKRKNTAAAYTVVDNKTLNKQINVDVMGALEGRVAGLSTFKNNMIIRGSSTLSSTVGTRPLVVIDGLPTEVSNLGLGDNPSGATYSTGSYASTERGKLSAIVNPNDIESITVLKDAAAAAIYGSRAANGVIVITTKSGKGTARNRKPEVTFSTDFIITAKPDLDKMHYASTSGYIDYELALYKRNLQNYNNDPKQYWGANGAGGYIGSGGAISYYTPVMNLQRLLAEGRITEKEMNDQLDAYRQLDYRKEFAKEIWRNSFRQNYNLAVSAANDKQDIYLSLNYQGQNDRMITNNNETFNIYLKAGQQINQFIKFNAGINTQYYRASVMEEADYTSPTAFMEPYTRMLDENGNRVYRDYVNRSDGFGGFGANGGQMVNGKVVEQIAAINAVKANRLKSTSFNILDELEANQTRSSRFAVRSFANVDVKLWKYLNFTSSFQYETSRNKTDYQVNENAYQMRFLVNRLANITADPFTNPGNFTYPISETGGRLQQTSNETSNYTWRNQLNFSKQIGKDHMLSAIAGTEIRQYYTPRTIEKIYFGYNPQTMASKDFDAYSLANTGVNSYIWAKSGLQRLAGTTVYVPVKHRYFSTYATANYTYKSKYNLAGSFRIDQADLFGSDPQYRYRPLWSVSAGWDMVNEPFLQDVTWLDMLKLRASYGITGNVDQTSSPYIVANGTTTSGYEPSLDYNVISSAPNPLLRWERTTTTNIGFDFAMFHNRVRGTIDAYHKYSDDLLATKTLDPTNGFTTARINNGAMLNKGIEVSVGGDWVKTKDWTFTSFGTFTINKNEIKRIDIVPSNADQLISSSSYYVVGYPKDAMYAYQFAGISSGGTYEQNGIPLFYINNDRKELNMTPNGNGTTLKQITAVDAVKYMGSTVPTWNASFQQGISFKQVEFNALFVMYGGYKIRKPIASIYNTRVYGGALPEDITKGWTEANPNTGYPKMFPDYTIAQGPSIIYLDGYWRNADVHVIDANYIRLRNISLAYTVPAKYLQMMKVKNMKVSAQANNAWYWFSGGNDIDPETFDGTSGTRNYVTPVSYLLRLDVTL
ncbi:TonB-linked SusC/RagA family outer membrane protein [Chitinophaga skermanii]|uniref:TonB-linked SusC/RagA family outer membrane protein n=2 Tax=Chitinophaga skermanii TaxID=331697 RepID=A0A327R3L3_9BACT|nr:TonB-linked SusC/RagA family outer membrane protein [Chitinophaga skermanii]